MKPLKLSITVLFYLCFLGCQQNNHDDVAVRYSSSFLIDTVIPVQKVQMQNDCVPSSVFRVSDKVIVGGDYHTYSIYSYPDMNLLGKQILDYSSHLVDSDKIYFGKGGIMDIYSCSTGDTLSKVSSFLLDKQIPYSVNLGILRNNLYIYSDMYDFRGLNEFHIMDIDKQKRISKGDYPEGTERFKNLEEFKLAYAHGLCVKPDKSHFVVYYTSYKRIRIYNKEGELLQDVFLDYPPGNNKVVSTDYHQMYVNFSTAHVTDKYIYLLNPDYLGLEEPKPECSILVIDWEGNLIARYRLNVFIYDFFIDESNGTLFGGCTSIPGGHSFFTFKLLNK